MVQIHSPTGKSCIGKAWNLSFVLGQPFWAKPKTPTKERKASCLPVPLSAASPPGRSAGSASSSGEMNVMARMGPGERSDLVPRVCDRVLSEGQATVSATLRAASQIYLDTVRGPGRDTARKEILILSPLPECPAEAQPPQSASRAGPCACALSRFVRAFLAPPDDAFKLLLAHGGKHVVG